MEAFETYFSSDAIVSYLCKLRAKVASSRNKRHLIHLLTDSPKFNYHLKDAEKYLEIKDDKANGFIKYENQFLSQLNKLSPPRKKWIVLGRESRVKLKQPISATDRNYHSLIKTIKSYRKKSPNEPWLISLDEFVKDIQLSISSGTYKIDVPTIYPKLKNKKRQNCVNECRPICLFNLKDRIILSITNKYLTRLFDRYFEDCSYAFRSKKNKTGIATLTHHDCIKDILEYKEKYLNTPLWVVECDMEKFYDTVNHKTAKVLYNELIQKSANTYPTLDFNKPSHIFYQFLECYAFNKNVPLSEDIEYWGKYNIPKGNFKWVLEQFKELRYYENIEDERIGIPQGGALSGLIANIILNVADKGVLQSGAFYIRFCDDMIILHPDKATCEAAKEIYVGILKGLKLVPHGFAENSLLIKARKKNKRESRKLGDSTYEPFWQEKSKGPYKWDSIKEGGFPWIGFVGYELHYDGRIRVRKKSFLKEFNKQRAVVEEIRQAVRYGVRKSSGSITESAIHRLVGMSVGRVSLKNYNTVANDLCWKNGFKELKLNKYSVQQIKHLDRNRNKLYYKLVKELKNIEEAKGNKIKSNSRQIVHFNKPFSYYYQILERKENEEGD